MTKAQINVSLKYWRNRLARAERGLKRNPKAGDKHQFWLSRRWKAKSVIDRRVRQLEALAPRVKGNRNGWHPDAVRVPYGGAGSFVSAPARLVWHTTEGSSLPAYGGSAPHFTLDVKRRKLYQHYPTTAAARALVHARSPETNNARAIQVELIAFSDSNFAAAHGVSEFAVKNFTDADYRCIAELARWIEKNAGVRRNGHGLKYENRSHPMSDDAWRTFDGHCGHQHVPQNTHWDPSGAFRIDKVLK